MIHSVTWQNDVGTLVKIIHDKGENVLPPHPSLPLWQEALKLLATGELVIPPYTAPQPAEQE